MSPSSSSARFASTNLRQSSLVSPVTETESTKARMRSRLLRRRDAGVDGALDVQQRVHLVVGAVAAGLAPLLDQHQDVVDVDLDLFDQLDLEDDVVVDRLLLGLVLPRGTPRRG